MTADLRVLVLPGHGDSGPEHWQTLWESARAFERVVQREWLVPDRDEWVRTLGAALDASPRPTVLVAHSLACSLVAHHARANPTSNVAGAFLVAPADVESEMHTPDEVRGFAPIPAEPLPFPTLVVASRTDPYVRFVRAEQLASAWGARFVDAGRNGHLNADSGHGAWPEGLRLFDEFVAGLPR